MCHTSSPALVLLQVHHDRQGVPALCNSSLVPRHCITPLPWECHLHGMQNTIALAAAASTYAKLFMQSSRPHICCAWQHIAAYTAGYQCSHLRVAVAAVMRWSTDLLYITQVLPCGKAAASFQMVLAACSGIDAMHTCARLCKAAAYHIMCYMCVNSRHDG